MTSTSASADYWRGWLAAVDWLAADPASHKRTASQIDAEIAQVQAARARDRLRTADLNAAQAAGPAAYAEARVRHGLVAYHPGGVWASWAEFARGGAHAVAV